MMTADWTDEDEAQALDWAMRVADPEFADWDGLTLWLEGDPARAEHFHAISAALAETAEALPRFEPRPVVVEMPHDAIRPMPIDAPRAPRRPAWRWAGGALAASLVAGLSWMAVERQPHIRPYAIETAPGATRTVTLPDGSRIALNGDTRIELDRSDPRMARLARGEAMFAVVHDGAHPFRVQAGGDEIVDVGTSFDVARQARGVRVAVSEGAVVYNPDRESVRLDAGRMLRSEGGRLIVGAVDRGAVGGWRDGRLEYAGAPIAEVAADLSRRLGLRIEADPAAAATPFRGTIQTEGLATRPQDVAALLGTGLRRDGATWRLVALP